MASSNSLAKNKGKNSTHPTSSHSSDRTLSVTPPHVQYMQSNSQEAAFPPSFFQMPQAPCYNYPPGMMTSSTLGGPSFTDMLRMPTSSQGYHATMNGGPQSMPSTFPSYQAIVNGRPQLMPNPSPSYHATMNGNPQSNPSSVQSPLSGYHATIDATINGGTQSVPSSPSSTPLSGLNIGTPSAAESAANPEEAAYFPSGTHHLGKLIITPVGDRGFRPVKSTNIIWELVKGFYSGVWPNWEKVDYAARNAMFKQFTRQCTWEPKYPIALIRSNFERKAAARLSDHLTPVRENKKQPSWIDDDVWPQLLAFWATEDYKKLQEIAKANRNSEKGGSVHTGGSITAEEHRIRLLQDDKLGRPSTIDESFLHTHTRKFKDGKRLAEGEQGEFVDTLSKETHGTFLLKKQQWSLDQPAPEDGSLTQISAAESLHMWIDHVGGPNKGRIYGVGSQVAVCKLKYGLTGESLVTSSAEMEKMHALIQEERAARQKMEQQLQELKEMMLNRRDQNADVTDPEDDD